ARPMDVNREQLTAAEADGYLARRYVNRRTGDEVSVLILCGRPGPIALHPPALCYQGSGYSIVSGPDPFPAGAAGSLQTVRMSKEGHSPDQLRIFWGWSDGGAFAVPANPRMAYAGAGFLYKLYVVRRLTGVEGSLRDDPAAAFVRELLPVL